MQKRRLGKTELLVSEIGFGAEWLNRHTEEESVRLIQHAGEQGINIIDAETVRKAVEDTQLG